VLTDSSKVGHESTIRFAKLDQVDVVITDGGLDAVDRDALAALDVEVVIA
jgi:DeoR family fructose operon transcriptional repressor